MPDLGPPESMGQLRSASPYSELVSGDFQGWGEQAQRFFIGLELDNSRSYFTANRAIYLEHVRGPMEALLAELEPEFGSGKIFRPNRDIRFSADKAPYKTNIAAMAERPGKGGYVSLSARSFFVGAGNYHMEKAQLEAYRRAVDAKASGTALEAIVDRLEAAGYTLHGEELKTAPQGFPRDHPRLPLLRRKGLAAGRDLGLGPWLGTPAARERVVQCWRDSEPLLAWFGRYVR
jgi:uncharacterized protein (TIGR02453 family)